MANDEGRADPRWAGGLVVAFVLVRLLAHAQGLTWLDEGLVEYAHIIEPELLASRPLESLWYLHAQPPGLSVVVAAAMAVAGSQASALLHILWVALGLTAVLAMNGLLCRCGVRPWAAAAWTLIFLLLPSPVLTEHWLMYTHLVASGLVIAAWCLVRAGPCFDRRWLLAFFAVLAAIVLVRSLFHLGWLLVVVGAVAWRSGQVRRISLIALLPVLVATSLYAKNAAVFGFFGSSSWLGMSTSRMTVFQLSPEARFSGIERGVLSPISAHPPFVDLRLYEGLVDLDPATGVPVLDRVETREGHRNLNHLAVLEISRAYAADTWVVLRNRPDAYLTGLRRSTTRFLWPAHRNHKWTDSNGPIVTTRPALAAWDHLPVVVTLTGLVIGLPWAWRRRRSAPGAATVVGFAVGTALFVAVVCNLIEWSETWRFRSTVDPLVWLAVGVILLPWRASPRTSRKS